MKFCERHLGVRQFVGALVFLPSGDKSPHSKVAPEAAGRKRWA